MHWHALHDCRRIRAAAAWPSEPNHILGCSIRLLLPHDVCTGTCACVCGPHETYRPCLCAVLQSIAIRYVSMATSRVSLQSRYVSMETVRVPWQRWSRKIFSTVEPPRGTTPSVCSAIVLNELSEKQRPCETRPSLLSQRANHPPPRTNLHLRTRDSPRKKKLKIEMRRWRSPKRR